MAEKIEKISKFLSFVLRHQPEAIGLTLDTEGWAEVAVLIECASRHGTVIDRATLQQVVDSNDKQRFALDAAGERIRANQGHSVKVDLGLQAIEPPAILFHGTASRFLDGIRQAGLKPGSRQHVHLSATEDTAVNVGGRHGKPVVLPVRAGDLHAQGHPFYRSENGVWLTDAVPLAYINFPVE